MTKPSYYITTPIYYPSDNLHIGHAYCTTIADSLARFHRLKGEDVFFLTGSDEHGLKIQRKAKEKGVTPIQYVDAIIANFKLLWKELNISNNDFIRTSQERHHKVVQDALQKIYEQGDIYKKNSHCRRDVPLLFRRYGNHVGTEFAGYPCHILFVFVCVECAGGVE